MAKKKASDDCSSWPVNVSFSELVCVVCGQPIRIHEKYFRRVTIGKPAGAHLKCGKRIAKP